MDGSKLIGMVQAVEIVTNGYRPSIPTCTRWATRGVKGIRLQTTCMGGRRLTTIENVERFLADVDAVRNPQAKAERRSAEHEAAKARLTEIMRDKRKKASGPVL